MVKADIIIFHCRDKSRLSMLQFILQYSKRANRIFSDIDITTEFSHVDVLSITERLHNLHITIRCFAIATQLIKLKYVHIDRLVS